jgi:hypothetical protein
LPHWNSHQATPWPMAHPNCDCELRAALCCSAVLYLSAGRTVLQHHISLNGYRIKPICGPNLDVKEEGGLHHHHHHQSGSVRCFTVSETGGRYIPPAPGCTGPATDVRDEGTSANSCRCNWASSVLGIASLVLLACCSHQTSNGIALGVWYGQKLPLTWAAASCWGETELIGQRFCSRTTGSAQSQANHQNTIACRHATPHHEPCKWQMPSGGGHWQSALG